MIEPKYLKNHGTIGIVAPSDGFVEKKYKDACKKAELKLKSLGYDVVYSKNCFNSECGRSTDAKTRAEEFLKMYNEDKIDILLSISGGEYEMEILDYLSLNKLKKKPKLFAGFSDNSILTFTMLTNLEICTIYGHNLFELAHNHDVIDKYLETLKGNLLPIKELSKVSSKDFDFESKEIADSYTLDTSNNWKVMNFTNVNTEGIVIGGLLDDLISICGTKYDKVKRFLEKYKSHGFIWYFDICLLSPESVKRALFQIKNAGWFKYANAIMIGRPIIQDDSFGVSYRENMFNELKDLNIPIILDFDLGHIPPSYHIVNGKKIKLKYENKKGVIEYIKEEI